MITLPTSIRNRPTFRIQWMPEGQWTAAGGQPWQTLDVPCIFDRTNATPGTRMAGTVAQGGYHLQRITRWCLPDEDRAQFYVDTGLVNGVQVDAIDLSGADSGSPGCAVKIQVMDDESFPNGVDALPTGPGSGWKTFFVGTVIYQQHEQQVGNSSNGRVTYFCAGVLTRTRNWPMDRHSTDAAPHAKGHPGYNIPLHGWFRKALGNKNSDDNSLDPFGDMAGENGYPDISDYYQEHILPLDGATASSSLWSDADAVKHALTSSRATGEPLIQVNLSTGLFGGTFAWEVSPGDTCFDFLRRICNRQRGRGSCFMAYDDGGDPDGNVGLTLTAYPSFPDTLTYNTVNAYGDLALTKVNTITGAQIGTTAINVDINGDHRITDDGFQYDDRTSSVFDMIVVQGEPIQVLCNLNFFGASLEKRWSATDEATFKAIPAGHIFQLVLPRWRQIWRRFGIPSVSGWGFSVKANPSSSFITIDYDTDNAGSISSAGVPGSTEGLSSTMTVRVLPDLPVYEGWRYDQAGGPVRFDGANDYLPPARMQPVVMLRGDTDASGSAPAWLPLHFAGFALQVDDFGFYITHPVEDSTGCRLLANPTDAPNQFKAVETVVSSPVLADVTTTGGFDLQKLNTIVGLELGTRPCLRLGTGGMSGDYNALGRRMVMTIDGLNLWLGAPGALWELDYLNAGTLNYPPGLTFTGMSGTKVAVLRDDRDALSFIATLAWYYFGTIHNPGTWTLRDCGLLSSFSDMVRGDMPYPQLGQFVGTVTYAGPSGSETFAALKTPISCVDYDNDEGETSWRTDYVQYDGNTQ